MDSSGKITKNLVKGDGHECLSDDSSITRSSTSMDILHPSRPHARCELSHDKECNHREEREKRSISSKRLTKSWKNPQFRAGRRQSLVQCLKNKITQPRLRTKYKSATNNCYSPFKHDFTCKDYSHTGCGDLPEDDSPQNQIHLYPACTRLAATKNKEETLSTKERFPFVSTPSGHYKLKPSQILYESKNLSILAADPQKVSLDVTDSNNIKENETIKRPGGNNNWDTQCLFTAVKEECGIPIGSEFSDSVTETEGEPLHRGTASGGFSEISLAKMGFVTDNCIDWRTVELPKKSDLIKLIMQNIVQNKNTDVQIKIGNSIINCHRIVLQSYSSMLSTKSGPVFELPSDIVPKEIFCLIYQWMIHDDSCQLLRRDNILKLYNASQFLGVKELEHQCLAFMENTEIFFEDKAFLLYLEARNCGNMDIMELMVPRVQRFFLTLVSSKEFVELSFEEVCTFLSSNYASIHNELEMFMAAVRWLSYKWAERKQVAVEVLRCVRFQYINSKCLLMMRRTKQPLEIERVVNIPEVSKVMDDAIAYQTIRASDENKSEEELEKELKRINLSHPIPRNWTGTHKEYRNYGEFLKDLSLYRSKHRLEIKQSKLQMHMMDLDDDDFLSQAVLPETTQKRFKQLKSAHHSYNTHTPELPEREREELRKVLCDDEKVEQVPSRLINAKVSSTADREFVRPIRCSPCTKREEVQKQKATPVIIRTKTKEELDEAARKIQKAYRGYAMKKKEISSEKNEENKAGRIKLNKPYSHTKHPKARQMEYRLTKHTGVETVFIFGGLNPFDNPHAVDTGRLIYKYITKSNIWVKCGELPAPSHYHGVCFYQGKIYVAGGKDPRQLSDDGVTSKVWRYDPDYKTWSRIADMLRPRRSFGFVVCCNRMFVVGGRDTKNRILSSVEKYDPVTESWVQVRPMLEPRAGAGVCEFNGAIWAAGGIVGLDCEASRTVERYDCKTNTWSYCTPLRFTCAFTTLLQMGGSLHLVGGAIGLDHVLEGSGRHVDVLDPDTDTWCLAAMMNRRRHAHAAVYMRGVPQSEPGHLLILGGLMSSYETATDDVECWREGDFTCVRGLAPLPSPMSGFAALVLPQRTIS